MPRPRIYHPLLFACFPILFYYSQNAQYLSSQQLILPLAVSLGATLLIMLALGLAFKNRDKALLILSLAIILFFALGPALEGIKALWGEEAVGGVDSAQLLRWWLAVFLALALPLLFIRRSLASLTRFLNVVGLILVLLQVGTIAYKLVLTPAGPSPAPPSAASQASPADPSLPHIYYIVLDGMGRADVLSDIYGLDGKGFVKELEKRGFYVAQKARANYAQTILAMASALNYTYLDQVVRSLGRDSDNRAPLVKMIQGNRLFPQLRARGYRIVSFATGCPETELRQADQYWGGISEFQDLLIRSTLAEPLLDFLGIYAPQADRLRNRILRVLDNLPRPAQNRRPAFVFAHLLAPHPPFLLGPKGEHRLVGGQVGWADGSSRVRGQERLRREYLRGYRDQAIYMRQKILEAIDRIQAASTRPVAIILLGDHGPGSTLDWEHIERTFMPERMGILHAFYLPGKGDPGLYPTISPVNSLRVVLNRYLKTELPLLPDQSFISPHLWPYRLLQVTDRLSRDYRRFRPQVRYAKSGLDRPPAAGAPWNAEGNLTLFAFGADIIFNPPPRAASLEVSLDGDDRYTLVFFRSGQELARREVAPVGAAGLVVHRLKIPPAAAGFDRLTILPRGGDQRYGLGHLRLPARG